jgi:hypothetical protein
MKKERRMMLRRQFKNLVAAGIFVLLVSISTVASMFAFANASEQVRIDVGGSNCHRNTGGALLELDNLHQGKDAQVGGNQFTVRNNVHGTLTDSQQPPPPPPTSNYTIQQTLSDKAQQATIAFDAFAFVTGDLCSDSFLPPGELGDFFGFQYHRDNDQSAVGHSGDYLTGAANNVLYILNTGQKAELVALAKNQVTLINEYAYERFPLMKAFRRQLERDFPNGSGGLNRTAVMEYSAELYRLDATVTLQRAVEYAGILRSLNQSQKDYLNGMAASGMLSWSQPGDQVDKKSLTHDEDVAVMTYAADIFSWYAGSVDADTYFAPERQAGYFGAFYLKDAPAMDNPSYAIGTDVTGSNGENFLKVLTDSQRQLITDLVDLQRADLNEIVEKRQAIAVELRRLLTEGSVDDGTVTSLMKRYGELDGEISYYYATRFAEVSNTLSSTQKEQMAVMRKNLNDIPCSGAYLYSQNIVMPEIESTDFLFGGAAASAVPEFAGAPATLAAIAFIFITFSVMSRPVASATAGRK